MNENEKKEKLAKLLMSYITANILVESLDEHLLEKKLFKRQTKFHAKGLLENLEKDIEPLYASLQTPDKITGYTVVFDIIKKFVKDASEEITKNI